MKNVYNPRDVMEVLLSGECIRRYSWPEDSYIKMSEDGKIVDQDGNFDEFHSDGLYHIYYPPQKKKKTVYQWASYCGGVEGWLTSPLLRSKEEAVDFWDKGEVYMIVAGPIEVEE